ncbi:XIAP-associated factor 1 isoform X1 [Ochotona curzoniae]|uniref:XIAP-associated factor 1 isoform X1 n=1 Tax=Ochotona curzoniae TaxID=130825 RepID=UPI001B34FEF2|nr:XIAP-associated factor 1 isoform X1 [Ochotona curzoniae]
MESMEGTEGNVQVCRNCKRSVASAQFITHEAHCQRFLVLCPQCEEPVPRTKMPEHLQEHQQAEECPEQPDKSQEQLVECEFCELAVQLSKLQTHEYHCGARTECCPNCGQFVMLSVLAQHKGTCRSTPALSPRKGEKNSAPQRTTCCDGCNQMIPENNYLHHLDKCGPSIKSKSLPPSRPSQAADHPSSKARRDVRPKSKQVNELPPPTKGSAQQAARGKARIRDLPWKSELQGGAASATADDMAYDILRRCSQCGILLPLPTLTHHQERCLQLASLKGRQVRNRR